MPLSAEERDERFRVVYEENREDIYFYLVRLSRDEESSLDFTQDTFVNFCSHYDSRPMPSRYESRLILFRIARNLLISHWRSFDSKRVRTADNLEDRVASSQGDDAVRRLEEAEAQDAVDRLMSKLEPQHREILLLRFDQGLSLAAIGALSGISSSAVSRQIQKAERAFRNQSRKDRVELSDLMSLVMVGGIRFLGSTQ